MEAAREYHYVLDEPVSGLAGVIFIHSTALGPAAGGCSLLAGHQTVAGIAADALRLARANSYGNALAGLPFGGGKAILRRPPGSFDRKKLFRAFGNAVRRLEGEFVTFRNVGTTDTDMEVVAKQTRHVLGLRSHPGKAGGDAAPWKAMGVFMAMQEATKIACGRELDGMVVAIQGAGKVGGELARLVRRAGARVMVADPDRSRVERLATELGAKVIAPAQIFACKADILAPCAFGGVLNAGTIPEIRARIICGAASNQLASAADGDELASRGIFYAPDYLVNCGGMINAAGEYMGESREEVIERICSIPERLRTVLNLAESTGVAPGRIADQMAEKRLALTAELHSPID